MRKHNQIQTPAIDTWTSGECASPHHDAPAEIAYEKSPQSVLSQMGLVLAGALGFTLAINLALVALHIG